MQSLTDVLSSRFCISETQHISAQEWMAKGQPAAGAVLMPAFQLLFALWIVVEIRDPDGMYNDKQSFAALRLAAYWPHDPDISPCRLYMELTVSEWSLAYSYCV